MAIGAISIKHGFERGWGDKEHKSPRKKEVTSRKNPKSIYKKKVVCFGSLQKFRCFKEACVAGVAVTVAGPIIHTPHSGHLHAAKTVLDMC